MIIVEGPDGAGKSTFVAKLADRFEMEVAAKAVDPDMKAVVDLKQYVEETLAKGFQSKIFDRFAMISGLIYGPIFSMEQPNNGFKDFLWLYDMQEQFRRAAPIIVWCLPPLKNVMTNVTKPGNEIIAAGGVEKVRQIYWAYHCRASLEYLPIRYDYTEDNINKIFWRVEEQLELQDG